MKKHYIIKLNRNIFYEYDLKIGIYDKVVQLITQILLKKIYT